MATYRISIGGQAPLQMQLGPVPPIGIVVRVREIAAIGEKTTGSATDPVISRPATPGLGSTAWGAGDLSVEGINAAPATPILTSYSSAPTLPVPGKASVDLPPMRRYVFPRGSEMIVYQNGALLLYATAGGSFTWTGEMCWEER